MLYKAGDVVETAYGVGVIVQPRREPQNDWVVRLWRQPSKSIASSALAYLQEESILQCLSVAPGMVTNVRETAKEKVNSASSVLVHTYLSSRQSYLVSAIEEQPAVAAKDSPDQVPSLLPEAVARTTTSLLRSLPSMGISSLSQHATTLVEVLASDLEAAPAAKFYPVLETLMRRADETATVARQLWSDEANRATQDVVNKTGRALQQASVPAPGPLETTDVEPTVEAAKGKLHALADQVEEATPAVEEQFRQILGMVKDEEITTLLENCKSRLEQLVTKDLSKATQDALAASGIRIQLEEHAETVAAEGATAGTAVVPSMQQSREAALQSIERILKQADVETSDLEAVRGELTQNFTAAFDALSTAARSDRSLNTLFDSIAEKTTVWQEASGRLLQTRSANLFMEGATRLQARAAAILSIHQRTGSEISSKMTKAFTEGDAAIARIKSIQLGDSLKDRLVKAIEVRSDSLGGLDAIIAGALTTVRSQDADANQIKDMLSSLQSSASTATTDARETLISILSRHNAYRDVALVKMESVLCDLESQFGSDFSPQDIAAVARGEGGTAKLFEPIARRAWQQIEKQLDEAESQVSDTNVLQGLSRVRKIMSGELTLAALTDEFVSVLNDENVVAAGQVFVQKGEEVLDALEGVSSNTVVSDALKIAEKVGITKDSVMREINKLDVDQLLDTAGDAVTDEGKRRQLVSNAIDTALDFILRILPSMPVPPFDGVRDGLLYNISNLSMQGFKVRKEDITIELAGMRASKRSKNSTSSDGVEEDGSKSGEDQDDTMEIEEVDGAVKATELLIIDVRSISAVLEDTEWSFEQTYMPYLKGQGKSDVRLSNGAIRLQFELRRRRKIVESSTTGDDVLWEPVLCLHDRSCTIGEIELKMQGEGKLTWLFNKAASIFKGPLRDYVVRTIIKILTNQSGWLLGKLNSVLQPYWDLVLKTAKLDLNDLVEADDQVVVKHVEEADLSLVELVWRERLPLGMNLLMNDESGLLKVVDFPRGSQARLVTERRKLEPEIFNGATIVAVNGTFFDEQDDLFEALKDPARPKTVQFRLAESEDAERVRKFVEGDQKLDEDQDGDEPVQRTFELRTLTSDKEIGVEFKGAPDGCGLIVGGFMDGEGGIVLQAERSGQVRVGDLLTHVNGVKVVATNGDGQSRSLDALAKHEGNRPLTLSFTEPYLHEEVVHRPTLEGGIDAFGGPDELVLEEKKESAASRRIFIKKFKAMSGKAEGGGILIGDYLAFVNGLPFGAGRRWLGEPINASMDELNELLYNKDLYPMGLTLARPQLSATARWSSKSSSDEGLSDLEADTICITVESPDRLGCVFDMLPNGDIVVADFHSVPGVFQRALSKHADTKGRVNLAIDSVNGQFVPSYATLQIVQNGLKRSWKSEQQQVDLWLCDDERRDWIRALD